MELSNFIRSIFMQGVAPLQAGIVPFTERDEAETTLLLRKFYEQDILEMPLQAPPFDEKAALWAAKYFYTATQLMILRDEGEESVKEKLAALEADVTASVIYSVDLVFRYLPALLLLAKGLSPADALVKTLTGTAASWPFSSAGIEVEAVLHEENIFADPSLRIAYIDRLIFAKDAKRINHNDLHQHITVATGIHLDTIWPRASTILKTGN